MVRVLQYMVPRTLLALVLGLGLALVWPDSSLSLTVHEPYGSPDGEYFREKCPKGSYLVGIDGRYGGWVNRIAPVCAPWLWTQKTFGPPTVGPYHGGIGGDKNKQRLCWGFGINNRAVQSWTVEVLRSKERFVVSITGQCTSLGPPASTGGWGFGPLQDYPESSGPYGLGYPKDAWRQPQGCPPGELGVGIHGRAGNTIQALALICGPLPVNPGAPTTKVTPHAAAPERAATSVTPLAAAVPPDTFTIVTPANNDRVQQGQLVVKATPPKVGAGAVTVLEFKYVDAPPNNPYSYTIGIETTKLLQGFLIPQQSTPGYAGRWEVRARTAAQPTPGPWSFPVQFQLFQIQPVQSKQQAPPPMVQQAPAPGSSVMQAPAPSSAATQMRRSPLMVSPRGVDEKDGTESNQTVHEPAKTETKP